MTSKNQNPCGRIALLEFNASLLVGHPQIDQEHQALAAHINEILQELMARTDREHLSTSFDALFDHVSRHFSNEERIMLEHEYPDTPVHALRHKKLLSELHERFRCVMGSLDEDLSEAISFIYDWFTFHIQTSDAKLADFLKGKPENTSA